MRRMVRGISVILSLALVAGCKHDLPTTPEEPPVPVASSLVELPEDLCGVPTEVALLADETVPAGIVTASNDESHLYVTYATTEEWPIHTTALYVADDLTDLPTAGRQGNPIVGEFPLSAAHPAGTFEVTRRVDLAELSGDAATIAAYAEVGPEAGREGAWGDGDRISDGRGKGSWATFFTHAVQDCEPGDPTAVISAPSEGASVQAGTPLAFDGSESEDPAGGGLIYEWNFGDGSLGGVATLAHPYAVQGGYTATLTVTDVNGASDQAEVEITVTAPPAPTSTDGVLRGEVTDQAGQPLANVAVEMIGGGTLGTSDGDGNVLIENFPTGVVRVLRLSLSGYTSDIVRVEVDPALGQGFFTAALRPRNEPAVLPDAEEGGTVTGEDGAEIVLPPDALVDGAGNPVSGPVEVAITPVDVTGPEIQAFPGGFEGVSADGTTGAILSYGATEFSLTQGNEELQLAPGATATLRLPIYSDGPAAGDAIPQWTLDEATGLWIREGEGTVVSGAAGLALEAEVGHLSWKNVDVETGQVAIFSSCKEFLGLVFEACYLAVETTGNGPAWADATAIPSGGETLSFPVGVELELEGVAFTSECVSGGAIIVEIPESGDPDPIQIDLECLDGDPTDPAVRLEYGDRLAAEIGEAGEVDRYVWTGETGDEVRIDLDAGGLDGLYEVRAPDGSVLESGSFDTWLDVFLTLAATGDHEITVRGFDSGETGSYSVGLAKFVDPGPQPVTLPATISDEIGFPELETDAYTFDAVAGDEVSFAVRTENRLADGMLRFEGDVRVFSPSDVLVAEAVFGRTSREIGARGLRLAETGTYRVEIRSRTILDDPGDPGAYVLELRENPATALGDGDVIPEGIAADLEVDVYSFEFPSTETVRVTLTGPDVTQATHQLRIRIHDPDGNELVYSGARGENHFFVETPAAGGEHRITIHGENASAVPDYELAFDVFAPQATRSLVDGDVVTDEIGFPPEIDSYTFEAQDGDEMTLTVSAAQAEAFEGSVEIFDPVGTPIASGSFTETAAFGDVQVLGATGTYTVEVSGTDGIPFAYEIALALVEPPDPNLLTPGDIVDGSIDFTGGTDEYTLDGTTGQTVRIHAITGTSSSFDGFVRLIAPSSTVLVDERFNDMGSANRVVTLTETGPHTIVIGQGFSLGTGTYRLGVGGGVGRPDLGFANNGVFQGSFGDGSYERVVPRASGGILALTSRRLFAFTSAGSLDGGFGSGGEVDLLGLTGTAINTAVTELSDGSIVVASPVNNSTFNGWRVLKLDGTGTADPSFGTGGVVDIPITHSIDQLRDHPEAVLAIPDAADTDILVVGGSREAASGNARVVTMARLNPDGTFDTSFGGGANPLITAQNINVVGAGIQSDGRIVVAGSFGAGNIFAYRYDPDGSQDLAFGSSGEANVDLGFGSVDGMAFRADDRFVVFGGQATAFAVQFTASGFADGAFGSGGIVQIDYGHLERALAGTVDGATGHLYLAGQLEIRDSGEDEGMLIRLSPGGSVDADFGAGGFVFVDEPDQIQSAAVDGSGRILVGGREFGSSSTPMLLRLLP